jgi:ribulose-phosphate 3-epimerase
VKLYASLLSCDLLNIGGEIEALVEAGIDGLHVDIMDGHFVHNIAFGIDAVKQICGAANLPVSVHMMVSKPAHFIKAITCDGVESIVVHCEIGNLPGVLKCIKEAGVGVGIAINPTTKVFEIVDYVEFIDTVCVMGVYPGFGGQAMVPGITERIGCVRSVCGANVEIAIDGGVNPSTTDLVKLCEADILIAGSYLFSGNSGNRVDNLKERIKALCHGVSKKL